jgi:hypothetical protein
VKTFRSGWLAVALLFACMACNDTSSDQPFSVAEWQKAAPKQRRLMAEDFLRQHNVVGMREAELTQLLGEPNSERDSWEYNLTENGPPPSGPQPSQVFLKHPQLYVFFRKGRVHSVSTTYKLELRDEVVFDPRFWAPQTAARLGMTYDLINRRILLSLDKQHVRQLLGAPDQKADLRRLDYDLGTHMVDPVTLSFTLDENDRVTQAAILGN